MYKKETKKKRLYYWSCWFIHSVRKRWLIMKQNVCRYSRKKKFLAKIFSVYHDWRTRIVMLLWRTTVSFAKYYLHHFLQIVQPGPRPVLRPDVEKVGPLRFLHRMSCGNSTFSKWYWLKHLFQNTDPCVYSR